MAVEDRKPDLIILLPDHADMVRPPGGCGQGEVNQCIQNRLDDAWKDSPKTLVISQHVINPWRFISKHFFIGNSIYHLSLELLMKFWKTHLKVA
jgi:hypothetical protein